MARAVAGGPGGVGADDPAAGQPAATAEAAFVAARRQSLVSVYIDWKSIGEVKGLTERMKAPLPAPVPTGGIAVRRLMDQALSAAGLDEALSVRLDGPAEYGATVVLGPRPGERRDSDSATLIDAISGRPWWSPGVMYLHLTTPRSGPFRSPWSTILTMRRIRARVAPGSWGAEYAGTYQSPSGSDPYLQPAPPWVRLMNPLEAVELRNTPANVDAAARLVRRMRVQVLLLDAAGVSLAAGTATALLVTAAGAVSRRRRVGTGRCAACGYDLRASPEQCPECGAAA